MYMGEAEQKRAHFRIVYPVGSRPKITLRNQTFDVVDLSEMGVRFATRDAKSWRSIVDVIQASILFADNEKVAVIGKVLRTTDDQVILQLTKGVPFAKVMAEQRRILQSHKTLKQT